MITIPSMRPETQYGIPDTGWIKFSPGFVSSYSGVLKSARWVLERMDDREPNLVERSNEFRIDPTIPEMFRSTLDDYRNSGFDRGHLVASANARETELENSGTFLMSNMSPQHPKCNRVGWKKLEEATRKLAAARRQVFVICGPLIKEDRVVQVIGENKVPVPHFYFKSVLSEGDRGVLEVRTFVMPNEDTTGTRLDSFLVTTRSVEKWCGFLLWDRLEGDPKIVKQKNQKGTMWDLSSKIRKAAIRKKK